MPAQLPGSDYVLLGIAVDPNGAGVGAGRQELRTVVVNRDPSGSQMTVTNACIPAYYGVNFEYLLLVQELATSQIGTIDPDEENEPQ